MKAEGITFETNMRGEKTFVRINMKKYGDELFSFFRTIGIESEVSPYNKNFVEKIKRGEQAIKEGKTCKVDLDNLWK
jgi:hypothetical protein